MVNPATSVLGELRARLKKVRKAQSRCERKAKELLDEMDFRGWAECSIQALVIRMAADQLEATLSKLEASLE